MKKLFLSLMALSLVVGCSSTPSSQESSDSPSSFVSYHSNKDFYYEGISTRKPSSDSTEKKEPWCKSPKETNFVSYGSGKNYYSAEGEAYSMCKDE